MFSKRTVRDISVLGKTVLVRTDYNVPMDGEVITDDLRIRESLPTLKLLLEKGAAKVVVIAHLGRPDGKPDAKFSLAPVAIKMRELWPSVSIGFCSKTVGDDVARNVRDMPNGGILLLENLRFDPREEENSEAFAQEIVDAVKPDFFVQDGFGVVHRAHASTEAITKLVPSVAGLLLQKEVVNLGKAQNPESPSIAIIGGSKVEDKAPLIEKILEKYDMATIGGKIANEYKSDNPKIILATDFVRGSDGVAYDIGPESAERIAKLMIGAKTVFWNGVLGKVEDEEYQKASEVVAIAMGSLPEGVTTVVAGGDTTGFVEHMMRNNPKLRYTLLSTGGGAAIEFLLGEKLPGIEALQNSY